MEETQIRRRRSPYWSHFQIQDTGVPNRKKATCNYCPQVLSCSDRGCTGNLARHIRQKHPVIMNSIEEEQANLLQQSTTTEYEYVDEDNRTGSYNGVYLLSVSEEDTSQESLEESNMKTNLKKENAGSNQNTKPFKTKKVKTEDDHDRVQDGDTQSVADRFDVFGSLVAMKMRELRRDQMILAEKLINDTLHEAEMDNLNRYCGLNLVQVHMVDESKRDCLSVNNVSSNIE